MPTTLRVLAHLTLAAWLAALASAGVAQALTGQGADIAQASAESGLAPDLEQQVRRLAADGSRAGPAGAARIDVEVGRIDPRLRLAPCARIEPYVPAGARLWGRTRIGLRCLQGAVKWNVYLPLTVRVFGPGLVATAAAPAGSTLAAGDLAPAEVDLAEDNSAAFTDARAAVGRALLQPLAPGQSLRAAHLKPRVWFQAGETVKVRAAGTGFSVAGEAEALTVGVEGQVARVRTEGGKILSGQPVGVRELELSL